MIKTILTLRKTLTLRSSAPNLFDIDSISLLIGKNGSGKTRTLLEIAQAFGTRRDPSLDEPCKIILDTERLATPEQLSTWGVLYYTPAQNRPSLRSTKNFLNASKRPVENLNNLDRYSNILQAFGLNVELTATLRAEYRKLARLLAEALLKNRQFRTPAARDNFNFTELDECKQKLDSVSEFEASQSEYDQAEASFKECFQALTEIVLRQLHESAKDHKVFACVAVVTHLMERRQAGINLVISLLKRYLDMELLPQLKEDPRLPDLYRLIQATEFLLRREPFKPKPGSGINVAIYTRTLATPEERSRLEKNEAFKLCRLGYPHISSGQWAIMQQIIALYESLRELQARGLSKLLVLIDEGDAFLHLEWQRQYLYQLNVFLSQCKTELGINCLQLILASHSPLLATDVPRDFVVTFDSDKQQPSFGAPIQLILNRSFGARTMGEFAILEINKTLHNAAEGQLTDRDHYVRSIIEDPVITREIDYLLGRRAVHADQYR
ncbi:hypothetical protein DM292_07380 [Stutzerimonas frequens]|uniref:AAA family ATPase n=1 Tax=Stutzerimonas frequens TaxID=2968969 RepID=UPI000D7DF72B|nr:AAA family ATPase [Stutzerimonas frequens]AWT10038.1 hypothetical protein DM292_07380 [Stutzerimonas frequens]